MKSAIATVLKAALRLPDGDRAELVDKLLGLFPARGNALTDSELSAELHKRWREIKEGKVTAIPWSRVRRRLRAK